MIDKSLIKKMMKDIGKSRNNLGDHKIMHPLREWFVGWLGAIILLSGFGFWCVSLYWQYNNKNPENETAGNSPLTVYRESEVKKAIEELQTRGVEYEKLKATLIQNTPDTTTGNVELLTDSSDSVIESLDSNTEIIQNEDISETESLPTTPTTAGPL